jgi:DNA-binding Lrp family transcriptional regulator
MFDRWIPNWTGSGLSMPAGDRQWGANPRGFARRTRKLARDGVLRRPHASRDHRHDFDEVIGSAICAARGYGTISHHISASDRTARAVRSGTHKTEYA